MGRSNCPLVFLNCPIGLNLSVPFLAFHPWPDIVGKTTTYFERETPGYN